MEIFRRLRELKHDDVVRHAPTLMPPNSYPTQPLIVLYLSAELRDYYIAYAVASERVDAIEVLNDISYFKNISFLMPKFVELIEERHTPSMTSTELSTLFDDFTETALRASRQVVPDEIDVAIINDFWNVIRQEVYAEENMNVIEVLECEDFPAEVGIFADSDGWCVALTNETASSQLPEYSKVAWITQISDEDLE